TWAANSWAKNVESYHYLNDGIRLDHAFRVQLEGVYVHEPVWPVSGGAGYNIECSQSSSEFLIENSISVKANKVMVARACGAGAVVAYNYMDDGFINGSDGWIEIGLNGSHWPGSNHILFEGNQSFNIDGDFTWGNAIYHTFFRNYATGYRARFTDYVNNAVVDDTNQPSNGLVRAAAAHIYHYWYSFIGNVLGTAGHMSGWTYDSKNTTPNQFPPSPAVWMLGWMDVSPQGYDPNVAATAIRHGNYDFLSGSVVWDPNLTQTLPASLYLSQTPDFFNAGSGYTWPWVDSTGGVGTLPAKARYDAGTPFAQP